MLETLDNLQFKNGHQRSMILPLDVPTGDPHVYIIEYYDEEGETKNHYEFTQPNGPQKMINKFEFRGRFYVLNASLYDTNEDEARWLAASLQEDDILENAEPYLAESVEERWLKSQKQ